MILLKDYITSLLPSTIKDQDSYKDVNQKGFVERYLEIFGLELDEFYYTKIYNIEDELNPLTVSNPEYLDYIAYALGDWPNIAQDEAGYRRFLSYVVSIFKIKGTIQSFHSILYPLGLEIDNFYEVPLVGVTYDVGILYDDPVIRYDDACQTCSYFDISLTGLEDLTAELYDKILNTIELVRPINAKLRTFEYNGGEVVEVIIEVEVDEDGNLVYNNDADPDLELTLSVDGDLIISGPNANRYYIDENGDLIYISIS